MSEQFHVIEMLAGLPVGIVRAEDEGAGVEPSVLQPGVVEGFAETLIAQVAEGWVVAQEPPRKSRTAVHVSILLKVRKATIWKIRSSGSHGSSW